LEIDALDRKIVWIECTGDNKLKNTQKKRFVSKAANFVDIRRLLALSIKL
jgi:hypothetical protein